MRIQEIIAQRTQERIAEKEQENEGEQEYRETFESSEFFGVENLRNAPACLEFRLNDGNFKAIPYSFILEINYNPQKGIEILTTAKEIKITGRNLKLLFTFLSAFRVRFVKENIGNDLTEERALFVKDIQIEDV